MNTAVAHDEARQQVVLFGGQRLPNPFGPQLDDTWIWDGLGWTETSSASRPPGRGAMSMTYDAARQRIVRYSGYSEYRVNPDRSIVSNVLDDGWEWDGARWTEVTPRRAPA